MIRGSLPANGAVVTVWDRDLEIYRRGRVLYSLPPAGTVAVRFDDGEVGEDLPLKVVHEGEPEEVLEDGQLRFSMPDAEPEAGVDELSDAVRELEESDAAGCGPQERLEDDEVDKLLRECQRLDKELHWDDDDD
jgi:hypothetical protein